MFVPDLHSFTTPVDHGSLYQQTIENLKVYLAAGLNIDDPATYIYRQSYISAHSELTWILGCFTYFGELSRMTQFKDKSADALAAAGGGMVDSLDTSLQDSIRSDRMEKSVSAGLFNYPVLMAADILLYDAKWVPVGEDQRQHLEFVRNIATRINNKFGEIFVPPADWKSQLEFMKRDSGARIRSLKNPTKKMSKSVDDPAGTIMLSDKPEEAVKKIMSATTDSENTIRYDWEKQPGITNLLQILSLLSKQSTEDIKNQWLDKTNYGELKNVVADAVREFLVDFQLKLSKVDENALMAKLDSDEQVVRSAANEKLFKVQQAVGLRA